MKVLLKEHYHGDYTWLQIEKPAGFIFKPGQYTTLALPGQKPSYFAIASHNEDAFLGFLIKNGGWTPEAGETIDVGGVMGNGFADAAFESKRLWLITHGSGISAFLSVLHDIARYPLRYTDRGKSVRLDYGVRSIAELPNGQKYFPKTLENIETHFYISKPESDHLPDNAIAGRMASLDVKQDHDGYWPSVLLIGTKEMTANVKEELTSKGIPESNFFANY